MTIAKKLIEKFGINESDYVYIKGMYGDGKYYFQVKNDKKLINQVKDQLEQPKEIEFQNMYYVLKDYDVKKIESSKDIKNMFESKILEDLSEQDLKKLLRYATGFRNELNNQTKEFKDPKYKDELESLNKEIDVVSEFIDLVDFYIEDRTRV